MKISQPYYFRILEEDNKKGNKHLDGVSLYGNFN